MKILYGVQGTGNGHIARARVMAKAFANRSDCEVDFVFSGRPPHKYFDMEVFGDYRTFAGVSFETKRGAIDKWATFTHLKPVQFVRDIRSFDASPYDLVLNDFEPVTAWAAKRAGVPTIAISHQAAFTYPVPIEGANLFDKLLTRHFAPSDIKLGVHWFHFDQPIIPPFIEEKALITPSLSHFLVYLPFEELDDIREMLFPLSEHIFECYHPNVKEDKDEGHIRWRKTSKRGFRESQLNCAGVIGNAGFELSSECLQLGKKLLIKPLQGQYEQLSNVLTLSKLDLCQTMFTLDTYAVEEWLSEPDSVPISFPDNPAMLINWILEGNWHNTKKICDALWRAVQFPEQTQQKLLALEA